nr:hypothetical protein [Tanacetum cinerariifolium]
MNTKSSSESHEVITIDVLKANDLLVNSDYRYLDVRTEEEFKKGHVDVKDVINIPNMFNTSDGRVKNPNFLEQVLPLFKKDDHLIVGCQSGVRSGFKHVYNMGGGYLAWVQNGLPVAVDSGDKMSGGPTVALRIAQVVISSWMRRAMYEKMRDLYQQDKQGGVLKKNGQNLPSGNQDVPETTKSLKVRIKVKIGNKDTGVEALTGKRVLEKRSRDEFEAVMRNDLLKKLTSFNLERKYVKVNSEKASFPKGRDEQRVRQINSKGTMKEKLEAARRKLREATKISKKKRSIQLLQSLEVNTPLPPESQLMKSTNKRFRRMGFAEVTS